MDLMVILLNAFDWVLKNTNEVALVIVGFLCIVGVLGLLKMLIRNATPAKEEFKNDRRYNPADSHLAGNIYNTSDE